MYEGTIVITSLVTYREMRYDNLEEQIRYKQRTSGFYLSCAVDYAIPQKENQI